MQSFLRIHIKNNEITFFQASETNSVKKITLSDTGDLDFGHSWLASYQSASTEL